MGTWGNGILSNDKALDAMIYLTKADNSNLTGMLYFMTHSEVREEQVLGAALTDTILNGRDERTFPAGTYHDEWIDGLYERFSEDEKDRIAHIGWEYANCMFRLIDKGLLGADHEELCTYLKNKLNAVPDKGFERLRKAAKEMEKADKAVCLNCGNTVTGKAVTDELGTHMVCPVCGSSFDVAEETGSMK